MPQGSRSQGDRPGIDRSQATREVHKRIAVAFDFDDTLAPDSLDALLRHLGEDPERFHDGVNRRVREGWDPVPAIADALVELSGEEPGGAPITQDRLSDFGRGLAPFDGVLDMFRRLREVVDDVDEAIELELHVVSSGVAEISRASPLTEHLDSLFASELAYDGDGVVRGIRSVISRTEKTRYLRRISQGLPARDGDGQPFRTRLNPLPEEVRVPLDQLVYVGDGLTDIPCFALVRSAGGIGVGLFKESTAEHWAMEHRPQPEERVENLACVDYAEGSELWRTLELAVGAMARRVALRCLGQGE